MTQGLIWEGGTSGHLHLAAFLLWCTEPTVHSRPTKETWPACPLVWAGLSSAGMAPRTQAGCLRDTGYFQAHRNLGHKKYLSQIVTLTLFWFSCRHEGGGPTGMRKPRVWSWVRGFGEAQSREPSARSPRGMRLKLPSNFF